MSEQRCDVCFTLEDQTCSARVCEFCASGNRIQKMRHEYDKLLFAHDSLLQRIEELEAEKTMLLATVAMLQGDEEGGNRQ